MMQVDLETCTGCGRCLGICPNEAIFMVDKKAVIDTDLCLSCGTCVETCPVGAIVEVILPVPNINTLKPIKMQETAPAVLSRHESRLAWTRPILSYMGKEIAPRLVDTLISVLDQRLTDLTETRETSRTARSVHMSESQRQRRQRRRGRKLD